MASVMTNRQAVSPAYRIAVLAWSRSWKYRVYVMLAEQVKEVPVSELVFDGIIESCKLSETP